jgi:glycosyltransferase involved in cell wall biosynthesis
VLRQRAWSVSDLIGSNGTCIDGFGGISEILLVSRDCEVFRLTFVIEAAGLAVGGGKQLALDLLSRLPQFQDHQFILFIPDLVEYRSLAASNVECIRYTSPQNVVSRHWALEQTLPRICAEHRADALLCLGNFVPKRAPCPTAVLVQNAYLVCREPVAENRLTLREKLIVLYGRRALYKLLRCAQVIVQTPIMRERLLSLLRPSLDPSGIAIIPNPCNGFSPADLHPARAPCDGNRPFTFLCLTRYYAHKNLEVLPEALQQLTALTSKPFRCIITISQYQHPNAARLLHRVKKDGLGQVLVNEGPVEPDELARMYRSADALILPTLLESCTRTYFEAMHYKLPVLASDRDFAHYLCGDAALYFDPLDPVSIAKTMAAVMANQTLRQLLVARGCRKVAALPTWDEVAGRFVAVLEQAAQRGSADPLFGSAACAHRTKGSRGPEQQVCATSA